MRRVLYIACILAMCVVTGRAQEVALKSNVAALATATLNVAGEMRLPEQTSVVLAVGYNPFTYSHNHKTKLLRVAPEVRHWLGEVYYGAFVGVQATYARYNFAGSTPLRALRNHRYQGDAYGASLTGGCHWMLSTFWNLEASLSMGYLRLENSKFGAAWNDPFMAHGHHNYVGPTGINLSLVYFVR